jgi:putative hydrolase of the HAD superfamily
VNKYRHLFFDLDNTLWDYNKNSYSALQKVLSELRLLDKAGNYDNLFSKFLISNETNRKLYRERKIDKKTFQEHRFTKALEENGTPLPGYEDIINENYMRELPNMKLLKDGVTKTLEYLYPKYNLYIITNGFKESQYLKMENSGIINYFKRIFISEEVGASKPDRRIFEYALKSSNAKKTESIMIGDSWETDILGAMKFGIDQIYVNPSIKPFSTAPPPKKTSAQHIFSVSRNTTPLYLNIINTKNTKNTTFHANSTHALIDIF